VIAIDVLPSDTTPYADVILPNSTYLERSEPALYANGVNHDLALTTRYAAIEPLFDTEETPDILLGLTRIVSGDEGRFIDWVEKLTGLPATPVKEALARNRSAGRRGPFSAACREVSFEAHAHEAGLSTVQLDAVLRHKGIYTKIDRDELLKTHAMPRKLPLPTDSGRIEFFSPLFASLRDGGASGPNFNVLAGYVPTASRGKKLFDVPLERDEFYLTYGKAPTVSYASTNSNNPVIAAINLFKGVVYTGLWIHPERAEQLGISTGDTVEITNTLSGQQASAHAFVTRMIHREAVFLYSSFGVENKALTRAYGLGTATNRLVPYQVEPVVAGFRSQEFTVKILKTGSAAAGRSA
jgi:anaerobic selenocysteine-containing dehydrogenase